MTRVFQGYRAALDAGSRYWYRLWSSAEKYNNLIGKGGQYQGSLAKKGWSVRSFPAAYVALERGNGSKGRHWEKCAAEFCLLGWSYDKNAFSIF